MIVRFLYLVYYLLLILGLFRVGKFVYSLLLMVFGDGLGGEGWGGKIKLLINKEVMKKKN